MSKRVRRPGAALILLAGLVLALPSMGGGDDPAGDPARRGAALLAPFKRDLQEALRTGLARGPAEAIDVCAAEAPRLAVAHSAANVRVGRTSHRLRNPGNVAPEWVAPILSRYREPSDARAPAVRAIVADRWGYAEPILVQPLCLTCHGTQLAPEVERRIAQRYPEDRAVGFAEGELRGVFWVEFDAAP